MKQVKTLNELKVKIKIWKLANSPCRLCRTYLPQIGKFIMPLNMANVVRLRVQGSLSGNNIAAVI